MNRLVGSIVLAFLCLVGFSFEALAQSYLWKYQYHATDCTAVTGGKVTEQCFEDSSNKIYKCQPTSGDCDTPAEWNPVVGAGYNLNSAGAIGIGTTLNSEGTGLAVMNGNVGIGTWNATAAFQVKPTVATVSTIAVGGGNVGIGTDMTGATAKLVVMGGNVGINTLNAPTTMYVAGSFQAQTFVGSGGNTAIQVFNVGSGTYTPNAKLKFAQVIVTGGGGGSTTCSNTDSVTGGAGAGSTSIKIIPAANIGIGTIYTVGAGGVVAGTGSTSSFGVSPWVSAAGGQTGAQSAGGTTQAIGGGVGGTATGGDINITGGAGTPGIITDTTNGAGGTGGASFWGGGGRGGDIDEVAAVGVAYGSGAGGCHANSATDRAGAVGADGVIMVIEHLKD